MDATRGSTAPSTGPSMPPLAAPGDGGDGPGGPTGPAGAGHYLAKELFERLHSTRDLVEFLERGSLDGMWIWDLDRRDQVWATHRFRELLGFGDEPYVGA
jgi:hypothetical protein